MSKKQKATPLEKLEKAWRKASPPERQTFLQSLGLPGGALPETGPQTPAQADRTDPPLIANGRYLLPSTVLRVAGVMRRRALSPDQVMEEIGFGPDGRPLLRALARGASLRLSVIAGLVLWLDRNDPD